MGRGSITSEGAGWGLAMGSVDVKEPVIVDLAVEREPDPDPDIEPEPDIDIDTEHNQGGVIGGPV